MSGRLIAANAGLKPPLATRKPKLFPNAGVKPPVSVTSSVPTVEGHARIGPADLNGERTAVLGVIAGDGREAGRGAWGELASSLRETAVEVVDAERTAREVKYAAIDEADGAGIKDACHKGSCTTVNR